MGGVWYAVFVDISRNEDKINALVADNIQRLIQPL
jgi:hypothetical protein